MFQSLFIHILITSGGEISNVFVLWLIYKLNGHICGVIVIVFVNRHHNSSSILDDNINISAISNILENVMYSIILRPTMDTFYDRTSSLIYV